MVSGCQYDLGMTVGMMLLKNVISKEHEEERAAGRKRNLVRSVKRQWPIYSGRIRFLLTAYAHFSAGSSK